MHPALACDPKIAAKIAVAGMTRGLFTGRSLDEYINAMRCDYVGARRIINGTDRADLIAGYAKAFEAYLPSVLGK